MIADGDLVHIDVAQVSQFLASSARVALFKTSVGHDLLAQIVSEASRHVAVERVEIRDLDRSTALCVDAFAAAYPAHTDGLLESSVPPLFALQCLIPDHIDYGRNLFWRFEDVLPRMPPWAMSILERTPVCFHNPQIPQHKCRPHAAVIARDRDGPSVVWRWDDFARPHSLEGTNRFGEAAEAMAACLRSCPALPVHCATGDVLLVKNRRILHGRTGLSSTASLRRMRRAWIFAPLADL